MAPNKEAKDMVLFNYAEEFGGKAPSHEKLYFLFAEELGIYPPEKVSGEEYYLPMVKEYNQKHKLMLWEKFSAAVLEVA